MPRVVFVEKSISAAPRTYGKVQYQVQEYPDGIGIVA